MSNVVLECRGVSKMLGEGAGQVRALDNVDLRLRTGELTMLMGPSGSGKTTLLSILGCMLTPSEGTVSVLGQSTEGADAERLARLRRDSIGFVFQQYHLFPTLSALENVQIALDIRNHPARSAQAAAAEALAHVGLGEKLKARPSELSGGEQQRVAIARAVVANPAAILADEPTAALDTGNGQAIMRLLATLAAERGRTVLVVSHDSRLLPFAHRVLFIEDGRLVGDERGGARKSGHLNAVRQAHGA